MAAIFLLQGLSELTQNESLTHLAFQVLGQRLERVLPDLLIVWFVAMLLTDSQGWTRILGFVVMSIAVGVEVYSYCFVLSRRCRSGRFKVVASPAVCLVSF